MDFGFDEDLRSPKPKDWRLCNVDQSCRNMSPIISRLENPEVLDVRRAPHKFKAQRLARSRNVDTQEVWEKVLIMATNLRTCHPGDGIGALNRLPGLAEPLMQIDLDKELNQLRREDSWQRETGRSSKTLAKYPDFRIVLILMKSGTRMRQQRAEGRISIQQLKGQVRIHLADRKVIVSAGHLLVLDCGVLHDVEALEESALLLTISWRREKGDTAESFSSRQRLLDEEAESRMDDEGSAPGAASRPEPSLLELNANLDLRGER